MKSWEERVDEVWDAAANTLADKEVIARIDALAAERGADDARAEFERAGARDSAGRPDEAIPLYRRALQLGLDADHEPQAVIQLASSLRNVGEREEAVALLERAHEDAADFALPRRDRCVLRARTGELGITPSRTLGGAARARASPSPLPPLDDRIRGGDRRARHLICRRRTRPERRGRAGRFESPNTETGA